MFCQQMCNTRQIFFIFSLPNEKKIFLNLILKYIWNLRWKMEFIVNFLVFSNERNFYYKTPFMIDLILFKRTGDLFNRRHKILSINLVIKSVCATNLFLSFFFCHWKYIWIITEVLKNIVFGDKRLSIIFNYFFICFTG